MTRNKTSFYNLRKIFQVVTMMVMTVLVSSAPLAASAASSPVDGANSTGILSSVKTALKTVVQTTTTDAANTLKSVTGSTVDTAPSSSSTPATTAGPTTPATTTTVPATTSTPSDTSTQQAATVSSPTTTSANAVATNSNAYADNSPVVDTSNATPSSSTPNIATASVITSSGKTIFNTIHNFKLSSYDTYGASTMLSADLTKVLFQSAALLGGLGLVLVLIPGRRPRRQMVSVPVVDAP